MTGPAVEIEEGPMAVGGHVFVVAVNWACLYSSSRPMAGWCVPVLSETGGHGVADSGYFSRRVCERDDVRR